MPQLFSNAAYFDNSWWNSVYRKIFGFNKWESVRELVCMLGRLDLLHIVNLRRLTFVKNIILNLNKNALVASLISGYMCSGEYISVLNKYKSQIHWTLAKLKAMMHVSLKAEVSARLQYLPCS